MKPQPLARDIGTMSQAFTAQRGVSNDAAATEFGTVDLQFRVHALVLVGTW